MLKKRGKVVLFFLGGVVVTILMFEFFLFAGGVIFKNKKENINQDLIEKNGSEKIIFCLGDSTTAIGGKDAWPYQLQNILNEKQEDYTVLNKGQVLADSSDLFKTLEERNEKHNIEYIIIMAGINDIKQDRKEEGGLSVLTELKTFDFIKRLIPQLFNKAEYIDEKDIAEHKDVRNNYRRIKKTADSLGAKLAVMQYPLRNVDPLKNIFEEEEGVIFISNEENFEKKVKENGYEEYFVDKFGGDFGHCTDKGNYIIAESVYEKLFE